MFEIKYNIKLNDAGRPYIELPDEYVDKPEDKFFVLELTRYLFVSILNTNGDNYDETTKAHINNTLDLLDKVSDEMAVLLKKQMENLGVTELTVQRNYHVQVTTIKERDDLNYNGIIYNGKIFKRTEGLKVLVLEDMNVYELQNGIDNKNWVKL